MIASDRVYLAVLGVMPIVLGVLIRAVPAPLGLAGHDNGDAESLLLILVIAACFTGAANAVRELVKERADLQPGTGSRPVGRRLPGIQADHPRR